MPQFLSSFIILSTILLVSQLVRLSEMLVMFGLTIENLVLPVLYVILPFVSYNVPIAFLGAVVVSFGRLCADGEYAALLASGFSLQRAARPVIAVSLILYVITAILTTYLEPWGRREFVNLIYRKSQTEIDNILKFKLQAGVFLDDFLGYTLYVERISEDRSHFENVLLAPGPSQNKQNFVVLAPIGHISGSVAEGNLRFVLEKGHIHSRDTSGHDQSVMKFTRGEIDMVRVFKEQIVGNDEASDDYRSFPPARLNQYINDLEKDPNADPKILRKARYVLHNRIATPFAVVIFAVIGLVLGVSDPRRGPSRAYIYAIVAIIVAYVCIMGAKNISDRGILSPPIAVWTPNFLLLAIGSFLLYQKNRLPPSESVLAWSNLPFVAKKRLGSPGKTP